MRVRPTLLRKIADNLCWVCEFGTVRCSDGLVAISATELLNDGVIFLDMAGHVRLTAEATGMLNKKTSPVILSRVLNAIHQYDQLHLVGNITYPVKFRRMTIEQLSNEGFVEIDGAVVRLTKTGKTRVTGGMKQITVSVPAHLFDAVNEAIRGVLDNAD